MDKKMKKVLVIEGQFNLPFLQNQLIKPFMAQYPGVIEPSYISWNDPAPLKQFDIICGHSLGGGRIIDIASMYKAPIFVTVDPRHLTNAGMFDWLIPFLGPFEAPKGSTIYNFYQRGFMSGYPVTGARTEVSLTMRTTHLTICGHPAVRERFAKECGV